MTEGVNLDELPVVDNVRRDGYGRYLIVTDGRAEGWSRVTTVVKALDSGGGLADWKATQAICGVIMRPGLRAQWEALIATHPDPWYGSEASKAAAKVLVESCSAVGGANDRREQGSSLHQITALVDRGHAPAHLTPETQRDVDAYVEGLKANKVTVVADMVEQVVVLERFQIAGTFDRLVTVPGFARPLMADIKTGSALGRYTLQPAAIQLAAYSRADFIYGYGADPAGHADARHPMPEVDQDWGLVMWLPAGAAKMELHLVNLDVGWAAFEHAVWARDWRRTTVSHPLAEHQGDLLPALEASLAAAQAAKAPDYVTSVTTSPLPEPEPDYVTQLRAWLQARIDVAGAHAAARVDLPRAWPAGVATLRASSDQTEEQYAAIEAALDVVERRHELPFPPSRPDPVAPVLRLFPLSEVAEQPKEPA